MTLIIKLLKILSHLKGCARWESIQWKEVFVTRSAMLAAASSNHPQDIPWHPSPFPPCAAAWGSARDPLRARLAGALAGNRS